MCERIQHSIASALEVGGTVLPDPPPPPGVCSSSGEGGSVTTAALVTGLGFFFRWAFFPFSALLFRLSAVPFRGAGREQPRDRGGGW